MEFNPTPEVAIIGGGINGIGIARELAFRGVSVVVIEQGDLCSGTSSASSKLVHGGIRYLEHGHFGLVADACRERYFLAKNAPHLVTTQPFYIPVYRSDKRKPWLIRIGLVLYEWISMGRRLGHNQMVSISEALRKEPTLRSQDLIGVAEYYDGKMDDARLGIECAVQAKQLGASFLTRSTVVRVDTATKQLTVDCDGRQEIISPTIIINAAGPWVDSVVALMTPGSRPLLRPTKGVHITTKPIVTSRALLISAASDNRVIFVIPHDGYSLIGTTDTVFDGHPSSVAPTADDIRYLVTEVRRVCNVDLGPDDIYSTFAGLRPLAVSDSASTAAMSRDHQFIDHQNGVFTMVGGKYTTFRSMSEDAAKVVMKALKKPFNGSTRHLQLPETAALDFSSSDTIRAAVRMTVTNEFAQTVEDIMRRRSDLFFRHDNGLGLADQIARELAFVRGNDEHWVCDQLESYRQQVESMRSVIRSAFE